MLTALSYDPGGKRMGWAVLSGDGTVVPEYHTSGIIHCKRGDKEKYQPYRIRLIETHIEATYDRIKEYKPDVLISEIVPPLGFGEGGGGVQAQLALTAITIVHGFARLYGVPIIQVGGTTIKKRIGGDQKATKVKVRNGVFRFFPELLERKKDWVKIFDEPDAIAAGLVGLGYQL